MPTFRVCSHSEGNRGGICEQLSWSSMGKKEHMYIEVSAANHSGISMTCLLHQNLTIHGV